MPGPKTAKRRDEIIDSRLVKVLAHPLRVRILAILEQRTASPSDIAQELEASLGVVSYHVRRLEALGLIKLVRKTPRRGAIEHYYKADARHHIPDEAWAKVPGIVKQAMAGATLSEIGAHVNAAAVEGGFGADDAHLSLTKMALDEQGWRAIARELAKTLERVDRIHAESLERLRKGDHEGEREAMVSMMLFESAQVPAAPPPGLGDARARKRRAPRAKAARA
jgi:DNA-binding transcriptional ArsR family regulator